MESGFSVSSGRCHRPVRRRRPHLLQGRLQLFLSSDALPPQGTTTRIEVYFGHVQLMFLKPYYRESVHIRRALPEEFAVLEERHKLKPADARYVRPAVRGSPTTPLRVRRHGPSEANNSYTGCYPRPRRGGLAADLQLHLGARRPGGGQFQFSAGVVVSVVFDVHRCVANMSATC